MKNNSQENIKDKTNKVVKYTGDAEETAQTSRNKKNEQMKALKEERSAKDNMPENDNYQRPKSESQHGQKTPKK